LLSKSEISCFLGGNLLGYSIDDKESLNILEHALGAGIRAIDTADVYSNGKSEIFIGQYFKKHRNRQDWFVASKLGAENFSKSQGVANHISITRKLDMSLKRLNVEYIDLYQLHHPDLMTDFDVTSAAISRIKDSGKIKFFGICNVSLKYLQYLKSKNLLSVIDYIQIFGNWYYAHPLKEIISFCSENNIQVLVYGVFGRGTLVKGRDAQKRASADPRSRINLNPKIKSEMLNTDFVDQLESILKVIKQYDLSLVDIAFIYIKSLGGHPVIGCRDSSQIVELKRAINRYHPLSPDLEIMLESISYQNLFDENFLGKPMSDLGIYND